MSAAWLRRALGWGFDLGALALAVSVRLRAWPRHAPQRGAPSDIPEAWWEWGTLHDTILAGPDAGAWAANVRALVQGAPLDTHRLPTFTYLAGWMTRAFDDVNLDTTVLAAATRGLVGRDWTHLPKALCLQPRLRHT